MKLKKILLNKRIILIFIISFLAIGIGAVSIHNRLAYREPYDGISLLQESSGIIQLRVAEGGPAFRAGLKSGDKLLAIEAEKVSPDGRKISMSWALSLPRQITTVVYRNNEVESTLREELFQPIDCQKILWYQGAGGNVIYKVLRGNQINAVKLRISERPLANNKLYLFLSFVGFSFLLIGLSVVLSSEKSRRYHLHFYFLCLAFFLLFSLSFTSWSDFLGGVIFWADVGARLFLPAIFLHFFIIFPKRKSFLAMRPQLASIIYAPAIGLMALNILLINYNNIFPSGLGQMGLKLNYEFQALSKGELIYFGIFFLAGLAALTASYRSSKSIWVKRQIKWILWGLGLGLSPLVLIYIPLYLLEKATSASIVFSILPLIIIPLSMAYAILKYKLMDVEVIIKRGMVFGLAMASVMAVYMLLVNAISAYFPGISPELLAAITFLATLLVAVLFAPVKNKIQIYLDKMLYKDRYDVRIELKGFSSKLSREVNLEQLLDSIVLQVAHTLNIENVTIALRHEHPKPFKLAKKIGSIMVRSNKLSKKLSDFISSILKEKESLSLEEPHKLAAEFPEDKALLSHFNQLHLIPFMAKAELKGFLLVGVKETELPLSSEDLQLLTTLAAPAAIAIENALLYKAVHRKAEELSELKEYLENIVESINAGVMVIDLRERIISWNRKLELLYGLKRKHSIGRKLSEVFSPDFLSSVSAFLGKNGWIAREITNIYKLPLENKPGKKIVVNLSIAPLFKEDGEIYGKVIIFGDMTERIELEEQLQHSEKLAALGYLAASVAHEVNTPLTGISSYVQMLLKQMNKDDPQVEILKKVEKHSFRASQIVNNLLNFSRKRESNFREIDINQVIRESLSLIEHQLKRSKIEMKLKLDSKLPQAYGDQGKLQQLFINMFLNARDSMLQGGTLAVTTYSKNSSIIINIKDTGEGIAEENLNKIYEPFFTTKPVGGTGLGLSVSYGIIQKHMGSISVKSIPGKGTSFKIKLPIYEGKYAEEKTHISN